MNQQFDGVQESIQLDLKAGQKGLTPGGPRSPVSGASKVAGPAGRRPIRPDLVLSVSGQNEDDEYRQNIEKEHLDKILSQELDFEEDDNDLRAGLTGDQVPSPGIIRKGGNVYPAGSGLDVSKLKDKGAIVVPGVDNPQEKPKRPPPGYRKPTIEATRKDVRHQNATPNEFQDPADLKKQNPLYHFDSPIGGREHAAATQMAPSQSNLPKYEASEHLTSNQSLKYSTKLVSRKSLSGAGLGKGSPAPRRGNDLYSRASASEQDLGQDQKKFGLRSKMAPSLSGATGGAEGLPAEKITSDYGLLQAIDERVLGSGLAAGHRGITTTTHLKKDIFRQTQEAMYGKTADVNHYELTETAYDEIKQSFDARNTSEINRQAQTKKNFALPPNKAVKVWSKERAYRNRSRERTDLEDNKDVTLYVGAVDVRRPPQEEQHNIAPRTKQNANQGRLTTLGIPGAVIGGSDSSKVIVGPQAAADLLGSLGVTQEGLDESIQSLIGLRQEARKGRAKDLPIGTGSASSGGSQFVRDSGESTFARKREIDGAKQSPEQRKYQGRRRLPNQGAVVAGESQRDETDEMDDTNAAVAGYYRTVQVPRTASKDKSQRELAASLGNKDQLTVPPSARNLTEATQRRDGDTSVAPSAMMASRGAIRNVGPGGEVVRLKQQERDQKAQEGTDPLEIQRLEKEKEQERIKNEAIYNLLNRKLVKLQDSIKAMTPQSKLHKLEFTGMDARQTIEKHNELHETAIQKLLRKSAQGKYGSASPARLRKFYNTSNTNLKVLYHRNNSGNIQDSYSVTTQVLSGHNTPLTYLRKKKEKLNQINKDQDDLLAQLRERERRTAASALKASKIFHDFVSNLDGHETRSDPASYSQLKEKKRKEGVEKARHSMYVHKMKPLHSSRSFQSWRGSIERQIEGGNAFTGTLSDAKLPKYIKKHLVESQKRGDSQNREKNLHRNLVPTGSPGKVEAPLTRTQYPDASQEQWKEGPNEGSPVSVLTQRQQSMLKKNELHMTNKELVQLRCLQLQQQESQMDTRIEEDAQKFFTDKKAVERDPESQDKRNALLERVRERLRQKVRDQLQRQIQREARKQERARRSSPKRKVRKAGQSSSPEPEIPDPRAQKIVSQLDLEPPTEQTAEGQASKENLASYLEHPSARSRKTSKAVAVKRRLQARGSEADEILADSARVAFAQGQSTPPGGGGLTKSQGNQLQSKHRKNSSIESGTENYRQSLNTVSDGRGMPMDAKYQHNNLNLNEESIADPASQINLSSAVQLSHKGNDKPARPPRASQRNGVVHKTQTLLAQPRLEEILQDDEQAVGQAAQDSLVNPASELVSLQNGNGNRPLIQNQEQMTHGEFMAEEDESQYEDQLPTQEEKNLITSNNQTTLGGSERETHGQTFQSSTRQKTAGMNVNATSGGGMTVTRGSSNRGHTASHQRYTTIQHPQLYFDQTARRIKTRNSVGQSQRFITTQMDARLNTLDFGTKNSSMAEIYSQKGVNQLKLRQYLAKPKTAKDRNRRNRTLMVGQNPPIPDQMQSINEYVQSQKILNENLHQYQMGQADLQKQIRTQENSDDMMSPDYGESKEDEPNLATDQQPYSQDQSQLGIRNRNQSSLWKENFKKRYEMGINVYNKLSKDDKLAINREIKKEFKHCSWARSNTKTDLDKSGKKGGKNNKQSLYKRDSRDSSPLQQSKTIRVQSALPNIQKQESKYQIQRQLTISEHRKSQQQDELRKSFMQDPVAALQAAQNMEIDLADLEKPPEPKKKRNGFKRYSEINTLSQFGDKNISLSRKNFNQIPLNLKPQFEKLCTELDDQYLNQPDFVKMNKRIVSDPENTKQTVAAQRLRAFKQFNNNQDKNKTQRISSALRQCDCHYDLQKPDQEMYKGIINLNKRHRNGINSQTFNSVDIQSDLRKKPWISYVRAQEYKQHMGRRNSRHNEENMNYDTFLTQLEDGYHEQLFLADADENLDYEQQNFLKNFEMDRNLDPNRTFSRRDLKRALKLKPEKDTQKNMQTQNLVDFIKDCYDEPKPKFQTLNLCYKMSDDENYKLKNSVSKYVDIEKVHQENIKNQQAKRRVSEVIFNESEIGDGLQGFDPQQSHLLSVQNQHSAISTTSKRKLMSRTLSHLGSPKIAGESENLISKIESQVTGVDGIADQPLVSLKEVFVEMIRNQTLDYENFLEPSTVEKFNQEKIKSSLKTMTKYKYKRKIWKPSYQQVIPKSIKILCDAKPAL